ESGSGAVLRFGPVTAALSIRFTTRDAATPTRRIALVEPPRLRALAAVVTPPAYTRLQADTFAEFPAALAVLPGTRIAWRAVPERRLEAVIASWRVSGIAGNAASDSAWSSPAEPAGEAFVLEDVVHVPRTLSLRLRERGPSRAIHADEGPWRLELRPDQPPAIALLEPAADGRLAASLQVGLRFRAGDDCSVSGIVLPAVLRDAEGGERRRLARGVTRDPAVGRALHGGSRAGLWDAAAL